MKIVLLNGPPRCGKDFAGAILLRRMAPARLFKMSKQLKERCHAAYGVWDGDGNVPSHDYYEAVKDELVRGFEGLTPREAYIAFSENWLKPTHGAGKLGEWLVRDLERAQEEMTAIVTDCGFREECEVLVERFGAENCLLVRIIRKGYDFSGDSRGYIDLSDMNVRQVDITNNGGEEFEEELREVIS